MEWLHYLIVVFTIPILIIPIILILKMDNESVHPSLKGVLLGLLLMVLLFCIVAIFHVEEMAWSF